jgi:hypothetical protein
MLIEINNYNNSILGGRIMKANKKFFWLLFAGLVINYNLISASYAETIYALSAAYSDVRNSVSLAKSGDTIVVPAGTATWNNQLLIDKGLILTGAGVGKTIITGNTGTGTFLIKYQPTSPQNNDAFRLTGFTFDLNKNCGAFNLVNNTVTYPVTNVRIHNNTFLNCTGAAVEISGTVFGVIDSNTFSGTVHLDNYGLSDQSWRSLARNFGSAHNMYWEDNTISTDETFCSGGHGGRYVYRYNTFAYTNNTTHLMPAFDAHGNQPSSYGTMVFEIYGNNIVMPGNRTADLVDQRGGKGLVFYNKLSNAIGGAFFQTREEYDDKNPDYPKGNPGTFLMHVTDSYYWANYENALLITEKSILNETNSVYKIAENVDVWYQAKTFDGTNGVGVGELANRPKTCTTGVGYWATNQSTNDPTEMIGVNPVTPISGTLYKCTSTNTWTTYYQPYTYPHPLRIDNNIGGGIQAPTNLKIVQ